MSNCVQNFPNVRLLSLLRSSYDALQQYFIYYGPFAAIGHGSTAATIEACLSHFLNIVLCSDPICSSDLRILVYHSETSN